MMVLAEEIAEIFGVDRRTVTNWVNEKPPCPSEMDGNRRRFDTKAVTTWWAERAVRKDRDSRVEAAPGSKEEEELRKLRAEADLAEMKRDRERGVLVHADDVVVLSTRPAAVLAPKIKAIEQRWAPDLVGLKSQRAARAKLRPLVRELLAEIAADDDLMGDEPGEAEAEEGS